MDRPSGGLDRLGSVMGRRRLLLAGAGLLCAPAILRAEPIRWRLAHALPRSHPIQPTLDYFSALVHERSRGAIVIDIFGDGELGQEQQLVEQVRQGRLEIVKASASVVERIGRAYSVFNLPFLLRDRRHWLDVTTGAVGRRILASTADAGALGLTFFDAGSRSFYGQRRFDRPEDLKGLRIRVQPSPTMTRFLKLLEAEPVQLAWDLTYSALSTGLVDGAENSVVALVVGRHGEVVRFYCADEHTMVPDVLLVSTERWQALSPDHRRILEEAAALAFARMNELWTAFSAEARRKVEAMGVTFTTPDKAAFVARTRAMVADLRDDALVAELVTQIEQS